jgi:6-phosphofructokinase 2
MSYIYFDIQNKSIMPQIVTITFSPSIDKSFIVPEMVPDKKLRCSAPILDPGGGGINVARAIKILGGEATAVFPSGGYTGKQFNQLLADEGVPAVIIESKNETRENIVVVDQSRNLQYRFGMPGTELQHEEWKEILQVIDGMTEIEFLVCSGSLPPGVGEDIYAQLATLAKQKGAKCVVDTSGKPLKLAIEAGLYLIKPNLGELSASAGKEYLNINDAKEIALGIVASGRCEVVVVSMGANGAMLVTKDIFEIYDSPRVERKSTVGAGDSMVAGIVYSLSINKSLTDAVRYGVACGTAATMNPGTELCRKEDVEALY